MCANTGMLNETLRNSWKFKGYVTSDCGAIQVTNTAEIYQSPACIYSS